MSHITRGRDFTPSWFCLIWSLLCVHTGHWNICKAWVTASLSVSTVSSSACWSRSGGIESTSRRLVICTYRGIFLWCVSFACATRPTPHRRASAVSTFCILHILCSVISFLPSSFLVHFCFLHYFLASASLICPTYYCLRTVMSRLYRLRYVHPYLLGVAHPKDPPVLRLPGFFFPFSFVFCLLSVCSMHLTDEI